MCKHSLISIIFKKKLDNKVKTEYNSNMVEKTINIKSGLTRETFVTPKEIYEIVGPSVYGTVTHKCADSLGRFSGCTVQEVISVCSANGYNVNWE